MAGEPHDDTLARPGGRWSTTAAGWPRPWPTPWRFFKPGSSPAGRPRYPDWRSGASRALRTWPPSSPHVVPTLFHPGFLDGAPRAHVVATSPEVRRVRL